MDDVADAYAALRAEQDARRAAREAARVARKAAAEARLKALYEREPGPCDDCRHVPTCAAGAACEAFLTFLERPAGWRIAPRQPRPELFERVRSRTGLTRPQRPVREQQRFGAAVVALAVQLGSRE